MATTGQLFTPPEPEITRREGNLFDRAILLSVEIGKWGITRKVSDLGAIQVDADKKSLSLSKKLIQSPEYKAIGSFDNETRQIVKKYSLPSEFRAGVYLLPLDLVTEVDDKLAQRVRERPDLVRLFMAALPGRIEEARECLRVLFNPRDFPSMHEIENEFNFSYGFIEVQAPGRLKTLSRKLYEREVEKQAANIRNAVEEAQSVMRAGWLKLVDHMLERLQAGKNGSKVKYHESMLTNMQEFIDLFSAKNLAGDMQLQELVDRTKGILGGVSIESIKTSEAFRDTLATQFEILKTETEQFVVRAPARKMLITEAAPVDWEEV